MTGVPAPLDPSHPPHESIKTRANAFSLLFVAWHGTIGVVSLLLAFDDGFAAGKVAFASDSWRLALGVAGALLVSLAARGLYRAVSGYTAQLTPDRIRSARRSGAALLAIGAWLGAASAFESFANETLRFRSWAAPFYAWSSGYLLLVGLVQQLNPTGHLRMGRVMKGEGIPGRARILRADDPEPTDDGGYFPVRVDFEIDAGNRVYQAGHKFTLDPSAVEMLVPGATVDGVVDRSDPEIFHVDWKTWRRPL